MASPTLKTDIVISIRQPFLSQIVTFKKNHEFRGYLLPAIVKRFWIYEPSPVSAVRYVAEVSGGKRPGEVEVGGIPRNADFNNGVMEGCAFAYEIVKLEELERPVTLAELKSKGWLGGAPQKYCYLKKSMARGLRSAKTTAISAHSPSILSAVAVEWDEEGFESEAGGKSTTVNCILSNQRDRHVFSFNTGIDLEEAIAHSLWRRSQKSSKRSERFSEENRRDNGCV
jgi:predicted transcriptional regulator